MPYDVELTRANPTCWLFLIDQSSSMAEPFGAQPDKLKARGVADGINRLLHNLVIKCSKSDGIHDYFHVGILGYGATVGWALAGKLAGQRLAPISLLAKNPLRIERRTRKVSDGAGGVIDQQLKVPIWLEAAAEGPGPMCKAFAEATGALTEFIATHPSCFPPLAINISDGKPSDGDPEAAAGPLRKLATANGNVLLFNAHLSSAGSPPIEFPSRESEVLDAQARVLFRLSSLLPPKLRAAAKNEGFRVDEQSRGFVCNADLVSVLRFLDIGTRAAQSKR